jgi:hypothetical protein
MPACDALALLATHVKPDPTYQPVKDEHSQPLARCALARGEFEIVTTGRQVVRHARAGMAAAAPSTWRCTCSDVSFVDAVKRF